MKNMLQRRQLVLLLLFTFFLITTNSNVVTKSSIITATAASEEKKSNESNGMKRLRLLESGTTHVMHSFDDISLSSSSPTAKPTVKSLPTTPPPLPTTTTATTIKTTTTKSLIPASTESPSTKITPSSNNNIPTKPPPISIKVKNACLNAYNKCFSQWSGKYLNIYSIPLFCDYSLYNGNACMNENLDDLTFTPPNPSKPFYSFLECTRLLQTTNDPASVLPLKQLSWNFLSYCISNSPTNSTHPDCFKNIQSSCTNPTSSKCTSVCINYIYDEDNSASSLNPNLIFSIFALLISSILF